MDMYQKREQRKKDKAEEKNNAENNGKMNINWYPGHMVKAQNDIKDSLRLIDIVIEILDARIPRSSSNPIISELAKNKGRIILLNKSDLADNENLESWKKEFNDQGFTCISSNANDSRNIKQIINTIKELGSKIYEEKYKNRNIEIKPIIRALIIGIPNVGKSTIINKMANKQAVITGNKPGVTKKKQWIRISDNIDLLDTPGLLWPKLDDNDVGVKLALTGNIKQEILDVELLAYEGLKLMLTNDKYKNMLKEKYNLNESDFELDTYDILEAIGRKRGCIVSGGNVDMERTSKILIDDIKNGKIGKISFDKI